MLPKIPVFFAENTTAVFLHINTKFARGLLALPEIWAEVTVNKTNPVLPGRLFTGFTNQFMVLVWADEQGGRKSVISVFCGITGRGSKTGIVAIIAAMVYVGGNGLNKRAKPVVIL